jgi:hypothetical protein
MRITPALTEALHLAAPHPTISRPVFPILHDFAFLSF